jgi:uncharacterized membrane protein
VQEIRTWGVVMHRIEPLFPFAALLLLGLGAWLVHLGDNADDGFSFTVGWILTAVVALVVVEAAGGAILAPRAKKLTALIAESSDGPLSEPLRDATRDRLVWDTAHLTTGAFLGVVFLMAAKPDGAWAVAIVVLGAVLGVASSRLQLRGLPPAGAFPGEVPGQRAGSADGDGARAGAGAQHL